jgi:hypothetical protein
MSEKLPSSKSAEELRAEQEAQEMEFYEAYMAAQPVVEVPQISPETCAEKVAECEAIMDAFEQTYNLEALRAITQFSSKEERRSSLRQQALDALSPIFKLLKKLGKQKALQVEVRNALGARYQILSQAVGNIIEDESGKIFDVVVHDRPTPFPW